MKEEKNKKWSSVWRNVLEKGDEEETLPANEQVKATRKETYFAQHQNSKFLTKRKQTKSDSNTKTNNTLFGNNNSNNNNYSSTSSSVSVFFLCYYSSVVFVCLWRCRRRRRSSSNSNAAKAQIKVSKKEKNTTNKRNKIKHKLQYSIRREWERERAIVVLRNVLNIFFLCVTNCKL